MIRALAHRAIWQIQHPRWDYTADTTLRALGYNETDRALLHAAAEKAFPHRDADTPQAGQTLMMLAASGVPADDMVRHLRAVRLLRALSGRDLEWATTLVARVLAIGRLDLPTYRLLTHSAPTTTEHFPKDDVRAGRVTSEHVITALTPKEATR